MRRLRFASTRAVAALRCGALLALCCAGAPTSAFARGALMFDQESCVLKVGPDVMYFEAYSPRAPRKHFCEDVPTLGDTVFTLDFAQDEMREMKTEFRILRDIGEDAAKEALERATVAYAPPRAYPTGTVTLAHRFNEGGDYVGVVTVDGAGGEHWEARFPFSVAPALPKRTPYYLIAAAAVLAFVVFVLSARRKAA